MKLNEITTDAIMALDPCCFYPRDRVAALLDRPIDTESQVVDLLLELPADDARWFLSRALGVPNRVVWAEACAERARGYAAAAGWADWAARNAARYAASRAAANAARAAHAANAAASYAASRAAANAANAADAAEYAYAYASEHRKAVEHAVRLMGAFDAIEEKCG